MTRKACCLLVLTLCGLVLITIGVIFIPESQKIIHDEISQQMTLNNSDTYERWVKSSTPIFFQLWMWDLTNPLEVKNGGKPSLVDRGPYTYLESRRKVPVTYHDNNDTVTYREIAFYIFDREMSVGPESDTFTTVNIPMMVISNIVRKEFPLIQEAVEALLLWSDEELFITLSVKDILWGYVDPLFNKTLGILHDLGLKVKIKPVFGLFQNSNGTDDGVYNMKSGVGDVSLFGSIKSWNYMAELPFWGSDTCNMVNGTDATIFHPFVEKTDILYIFSADLCRSLYLQYAEDAEREGIQVYRFVVPDSVFADYRIIPANRGFCITDYCHSGLLDLSNCRDGAPIVFSQPHFLGAGQEVLDSVNGIHPDLAQHQTVIDVEPLTGQTFSAAKKLQINIQMQKTENIKQTLYLRDLALPVIWLNESSVISKSLADEFKSKVQTPMRALHDGTWVAIGLGAALVCFTSLYVLLKKIRKKRMTSRYQMLE